LTVLPTDLRVFKGTDPNVDSYSAFWDNEKSSETKLDQMLKKHGIEEIVLTGLAFDICVGNTALDGAAKGYKVTVFEDATRSITHEGYKIMKEKMMKNGVRIAKGNLLNTGIRIPALSFLLLLLSLSLVLY